MSAHGWSKEGLLPGVNPVRNSSGALNPAGIALKPNPAAEQRGIISNGVKVNTGAVRPHHPIGPGGLYSDPAIKHDVRLRKMRS